MRLDPEQEEHIDDQRPRKAVGLFARDAYGTGVFELSALSTASGAILSTTPANVTVEGAQFTIGNVTLNPGPNHVGSVTIFGDVSVIAGMTTLFPGPNQIGSVTISNTPAVTQSGTWNVGVTGLLSLASGTEVRSRPISNVTLNSSNAYIGLVTIANTVNVAPVGNITLNASSAHIGSVSVFGTINSTPGMTTLFPGPNYIGLVTAWVANTVGNATLNPSPNFIGIVTVANQPALVASTAHIGSVSIFGTVETSAGAVTLFPGPNQIGSVTVSNTVAVSNAGLTELASAIDTEVQVDVVGALPAGNNNIGDVDIASIAAGSNYIGLVTASIVGTVNTGMTTIFPGPNFIGLVTISGLSAVTATNLDIRDLTNTDVVTAELSAVDNAVLDTIDAVLDTIKVDTEAIETAVEAIQAAQLPDGHNVTVDNATIAVTQSGTWNAGITGLLSLASGTEIRTRPISNITLNPSSAHIGSVSIFGDISVSAGMTTLFPGPNYIGLVSVSGNVAVSAIAAGNNNIGDVDIASIAAGDNNIGNVDVVSLPATPAGGNFIGLVTVAPRTDYIGLMTVTQANQSQVTLFPSPNFIGLTTTVNGAGSQFMGLVTNYPGRSATTVFATVISASGYSTIFVPPSNQRFYIQAYQINSKGLAGEGFIGSASLPIWHYDSLVTYGKTGMTFNEPGIPAESVNLSLTIRQMSIVTLSASFHVRFEA